METLPIDAVLPRLLEALAAAPAAVLSAPPGAGKTTRVPLALVNAPWLTGRVLILEPRRIAARAAAERLAASLGSPDWPAVRAPRNRPKPTHRPTRKRRRRRRRR